MCFSDTQQEMSEHERYGLVGQQGPQRDGWRHVGRALLCLVWVAAGTEILRAEVWETEADRLVAYWQDSTLQQATETQDRIALPGLENAVAKGVAEDTTAATEGAERRGTGSTSFGAGLFRYSPWGHSLYADEHPNFVRMDIPYTTMQTVYDWADIGRGYRFQTMGVFGFQVPLWYGQVVDSTMAISVTAAMSANIWMDLFGGKTSPIVDTDYRIGLPTIAFLHRINRGFAKNYAVSWSPLKHESTHIGDELQIRNMAAGYALRRVNVSYNYTEWTFTLNEAEDRYAENHCFRVGLMLLWDWDKGWYKVDEEDGEASLTQPRRSPWEAYLQYQYQSPTSRHGIQGIVSAEVRNRAVYGYDLNNKTTDNQPIMQNEGRAFTYNVFVGGRYNTPRYDGYFSRIAVGIRAYHGNCPYGQFRNIRGFSHVGLSVMIE